MQILGINNYYQPKYLNVQKQRKTNNIQQLQTIPDSFTFRGITVNGFKNIHNFKNIKNPENRAFFEELKKNFKEVPYFKHHDSWYDIPSYVIEKLYESCLDANDVVNKYAAQVLFNICHVSGKSSKELNIPEWNIKKEKSKVFEDWGLDGVKNLLEASKDKNGNHNINNLKFMLYLDKTYELFGPPCDLTRFIKACKDENGVVTDTAMERFMSVYKANGGHSLVYDIDKIKNLSQKGMHLIELIQSRISRDYYSDAPSEAMINMCSDLLKQNTGKDKEKVYDIIYDNLDFIKYCSGKESRDVVSYFSSDETPIFTKALDKNKVLNAKNLKTLFELKKNGEDELYNAAEFLKDKKGIIRKENFEPYKKISEYIFDEEGGFPYYKDFSDLNECVKEFRDKEGNLNAEFINKLAELCEREDIHSHGTNVKILTSILEEMNKKENINWDYVETLYKYAIQERKNMNERITDKLVGASVVAEFKDKATGKIDPNKIDLVKLYPNKSIQAIEQMLEEKNAFQSYIKGQSDIGNLYMAEDMLELLRDMREEDVLEGVNLTIPIRDGDSPLLMYIADILPTEENAKKYDKIIKILGDVKRVNYNFKDEMGVSFLEKVMMSENFKLLDLIKDEKLDYYPELEYVYQNIQNPEFKENVSRLQFRLSDFNKQIGKSEKIEKKAESIEEEKPLLAIAINNTIGSKKAENNNTKKTPATLEDCHTIGDVIRHRRALTSYKDRWNK